MSITFNMESQADTAAKMASRPSAPSQSLVSLKAGQSARIVDVMESGAMGERLLEMGLTPNTLVRVLRRGWRGGSVLVEVRGYTLSLSRLHAEHIHVDAL